MTKKTKQALYEALQNIIVQKIATASDAIQAAIESRDNETKSSVGDKYETGRAMMQQEQHRNEVQLAKVVQLKKELSTIDLDKQSDSIGVGSLVKTNRGRFFLSIGIGKVLMEGSPYYAISMASPMGKALFGQVEGSRVTFQGKELHIETVL